MGPNPDKQVSVSVWLGVDTNRQVLELCREQGVKRAQFVRRAVEDAVVRAKEEGKIRERIRAEQDREFMLKTLRIMRQNERRKKTTP
jgi:hypothetical protein